MWEEYFIWLNHKVNSDNYGFLQNLLFFVSDQDFSTGEIILLIKSIINTNLQKERLISFAVIKHI